MEEIAKKGMGETTKAEEHDTRGHGRFVPTFCGKEETAEAHSSAWVVVVREDGAREVLACLIACGREEEGNRNTRSLGNLSFWVPHSSVSCRKDVISRSRSTGHSGDGDLFPGGEVPSVLQITRSADKSDVSFDVEKEAFERIERKTRRTVGCFPVATVLLL